MGNRLHRSQSSQACPTAESVCSAAGSEVAATWRDKNVSPLPQYHQCRAKHCHRDYLDRLLGWSFHTAKTQTRHKDSRADALSWLDVACPDHLTPLLGFRSGSGILH